MIEILRGTEGKIAVEVAAMSVTDQAGLSGLKDLSAVLAANAAGRA